MPGSGWAVSRPRAPRRAEQNRLGRGPVLGRRGERFRRTLRQLSAWRRHRSRSTWCQTRGAWHTPVAFGGEAPNACWIDPNICGRSSTRGRHPRAREAFVRPLSATSRAGAGSVRFGGRGRCQWTWSRIGPHGVLPIARLTRSSIAGALQALPLLPVLPFFWNLGRAAGIYRLRELQGTR
jgi:hypothetical protein